MNSSLKEIQFCGTNNEFVLVLDSDGAVQKSQDKGKTFSNMHEEFKRKASLEQDSVDDEIGAVKRIITHTLDKRIVIFVGTHGFNWYSDNCGDTIRALNHGRPMEEILIHPTDTQQILASAQSVCDDFNEDEPCSIFKELQQSTDSGITWNHMLKQVVDFDWAWKDGGEFNKQRLIVTFESGGIGHQSYGTFKHEIDLCISDDFFKTHKIVLQGGNKFVVQKKFILVAKPLDINEQTIELQVGTLESGQTKFHLAELPLKGIHDKTQSLIATSSSQIILNVRHQSNHEEYGNIYTSDSTGTRFNLSLLYNVRDQQGICDVAKIDNMTGVFIANYQDSVNSPSQDSSGNTKAIDGNVRSTITFSRGGTWRPIKQNSMDSLGNKIQCPDSHCSLHLHNQGTHRYGPIYSSKNAVGIIIAVGNVGQKLENSPSMTNTWISTNGGITFQEILKGSHIQEIGDHGALIVLADDQNETNEVKFSWNFGTSWETFKFANEKMLVDNVAIETDGKSSIFQVQGHNQSDKGLIQTLDFSNLHEPMCRGLDNINHESSDQEYFQPAAESETGCILGRQVQFARRKIDHQCRVGEDTPRVKEKKNCVCTEEDWECDVGFHRDHKNHDNLQACIPFSRFKHMVKEPPRECPAGETQALTSGQRKVAGNTCENGVDHSPIILPCPGSYFAFGSFRNMLQFVVLILVIIIILLQKDNILSIMKFKNEQKGLDEGPHTLDNVGQNSGFDGIDDKKQF